MLKKFKTMTKDWVKEKKGQLPKNYRTLTMCEKCYAFKYKNSWHFKRPDGYFSSEQEIPVIFTQCVACLEQENALYENESDLVLSSRLG